jgi:hypothetical protein
LRVLLLALSAASTVSWAQRGIDDLPIIEQSRVVAAGERVVIHERHLRVDSSSRRRRTGASTR